MFEPHQQKHKSQAETEKPQLAAAVIAPVGDWDKLHHPQAGFSVSAATKIWTKQG